MQTALNKENRSNEKEVEEEVELIKVQTEINQLNKNQLLICRVLIIQMHLLN